MVCKDRKFTLFVKYFRNTDYQKSFLIIIESVLIDWECKGFHTFTKVFIRMGKYKI